MIANTLLYIWALILVDKNYSDTVKLFSDYCYTSLSFVITKKLGVRYSIVSVNLSIVSFK